MLRPLLRLQPAPNFHHKKKNSFPLSSGLSLERKELTSESSSEETEGEVEREDILLPVFSLFFPLFYTNESNIIIGTIYRSPNATIDKWNSFF